MILKTLVRRKIHSNSPSCCEPSSLRLPRRLILRNDFSTIFANASRARQSVVRFADWIPFLARIDIVIVSTAAPVYVVGPDVLRQACSSRQGRPLFLIDLSVPRNVDPQCAELDGVTLYDMDAMQEIAQQTLRHRTAAVRQGEAIVDAWLREFSSDSVRTPVYPEGAEFLS